MVAPGYAGRQAAWTVVACELLRALRFVDQFRDPLDGNRFAEMVALHLVAIVLAEECYLIVRFDALRDDP
jgi:hypothetical protein